jgi:hypothetical protein
MSDQLTPEQVIRLLHAKAAELEHVARQRIPEATEVFGVEYLIADLGLLYGLMADHAERVEGLLDRMTIVIEQQQMLIDALRRKVPG